MWKKCYKEPWSLWEVFYIFSIFWVILLGLYFKLHMLITLIWSQSTWGLHMFGMVILILLPLTLCSLTLSIYGWIYRDYFSDAVGLRVLSYISGIIVIFASFLFYVVFFFKILRPDVDSLIWIALSSLLLISWLTTLYSWRKRVSL